MASATGCIIFISLYDGRLILQYAVHLCFPAIKFFSKSFNTAPWVLFCFLYKFVSCFSVSLCVVLHTPLELDWLSWQFLSARDYIEKWLVRCLVKTSAIMKYIRISEATMYVYKDNLIPASFIAEKGA